MKISVWIDLTSFVVTAIYSMGKSHNYRICSRVIHTQSLFWKCCSEIPRESVKSYLFYVNIPDNPHSGHWWRHLCLWRHSIWPRTSASQDSYWTYENQSLQKFEPSIWRNWWSKDPQKPHCTMTTISKLYHMGLNRIERYHENISSFWV